MLNNLILNKTKWNDLKWAETTFKDIERPKKQFILRKLSKTTEKDLKRAKKLTNN